MRNLFIMRAKKKNFKLRPLNFCGVTDVQFTSETSEKRIWFYPNKITKFRLFYELKDVETSPFLFLHIFEGLSLKKIFIRTTREGRFS